MQSGNPQWFELIDGELAAREKRRPLSSVGLNMTPEWKDLMLAAAEKRNLSFAAYCRRAVMAFVCADLGLDWEEVMASEPRIRPWRPLDAKPERKAGYGGGKWKINGLGEYEDDGSR